MGPIETGAGANGSSQFDLHAGDHEGMVGIPT